MKSTSMRAALDLPQKRRNLFVIQGRKLPLFDAGQRTGSRRVEADVANQNSLLQGFVEYAVDVLDRLGGKALRAVLCGFAQGIVKGLDHVSIQ